MPEDDKKLVAHMQTIAERELRAKKTRLSGGHRGGDNGVRGGRGGEGEGGITKALRTFDTIMEGKYVFIGLRIFSENIVVLCPVLNQWCTLMLLRKLRVEYTKFGQ